MADSDGTPWWGPELPEHLRQAQGQGHEGPDGVGRGAPGSRAAGLAMAFKLIEAAELRWPSVNAPHLVALVRAGATFDKGVMIERPTQQDQEAAA